MVGRGQEPRGRGKRLRELQEGSVRNARVFLGDTVPADCQRVGRTAQPRPGENALNDSGLLELQRVVAVPALRALIPPAGVRACAWSGLPAMPTSRNVQAGNLPSAGT